MPISETRTRHQDWLQSSAHRVWLAGLAALAALDEEGDELFEQLVDEGRRLVGESRSGVEESTGARAGTDLEALLASAGELREIPPVTWEVKEAPSAVSPDWLIDTAALFAARHPSLRGRASDLRSLLAWEAAKGKIAIELAGGPRRVVTAAEIGEERQVRIAAEAIADVWQEKVLESRQVALALGVKETNREKVSSLRRRSWLLGVPRDQGYLYPAFQLDLVRRDLYPEVRQVNEILGAADDPWGVASWWLSTNDRLGARPADLVGTDRSEEVVQAARAMTAPVG